MLILSEKNSIFSRFKKYDFIELEYINKNTIEINFFQGTN